MPTIQTELRVQIEGGQAPVLVRRQPVQVHRLAEPIQPLFTYATIP